MNASISRKQVDVTLSLPSSLSKVNKLKKRKKQQCKRSDFPISLCTRVVALMLLIVVSSGAQQRKTPQDSGFEFY